MLYILFGQDDFSLQEALAGIKRGLGDEELLTASTNVLDGRRLSPNQLGNTCNVAPFLAQNRLVIVHGLLARFEQRWGVQKRYQITNSDQKGGWQDFCEYIGGMPATTVLVLTDGKIRNDNPLLRKLTPLATVMSFPPLRGARLYDWIRSRVVMGGGSISPGAVRLLAQVVGGDLGTLANEVEKLLLYTSGCHIGEDNVRKVVSYAREANIFAMVDAVLERRTSQAMRLLHQLLDEGESLPYIMTMIARQLRLLVQAKELISRRVPAAEIQDRLGISKGYALDKTLAQTGEYSMEQLEWLYRKLLETDVAIKTGKWKDELALDLLLAELCQAGRG